MTGFIFAYAYINMDTLINTLLALALPLGFVASAIAQEPTLLLGAVDERPTGTAGSKADAGCRQCTGLEDQQHPIQAAILDVEQFVCCKHFIEREE